MRLNAAQAIDESIANSSITHLPFDAEVIEDLRLLADDEVEDTDRGVHEFWGGEGRDEWRVHVALD